MSVERNLLISVLKLTQNGPTTQESVKLDAQVPLELCSRLTAKLQNENNVYLNGDQIKADTPMRLRIAAKAASLGADIESLSRLLKWQEFEEITSEALNLNGYATMRTMRFSQCGRRWEIDVVGCKKPLVVCVDCKHWSRGLTPSALRKIASDQADRVEALANSLPNVKWNLPCTKWEKAKFVPVILSLGASSTRFCGNIPVVPVLMLQDFINQLSLNIESLEYFSKRFFHL